MMSWVLLSILASLAWAIVNVYDKFFMENWLKNPLIPTFFASTIGLVSAIAVYFTKGITILTGIHFILALIAGICYILCILLYMRSVKLEEVSRIVPLFYIMPIFVLILAYIFLGELFTVANYIGIALLIIGAVVISFKGSVSKGKAATLMVASAVFLAVHEVIIKFLLNMTDYWTVFSYIRVLGFIAFLPALYWCWSDTKKFYEEHKNRGLLVMTFSQAFSILGFFLVTIASALGPITLVNSVTVVQSLFVLGIVYILTRINPKLLGEKIDKYNMTLKIVAIVMMSIGAILVS